MDIALILVTLPILAVGIFFFVRWAWNKIFPEHSGTLDHVPVNRRQPEVKPAEPKKVGTTAEEAKIKHGKPFKAHTLVKRETPLSRDLVEMNELSAKKAEHTVTALPRKKQG